MNGHYFSNLKNQIKLAYINTTDPLLAFSDSTAACIETLMKTPAYCVCNVQGFFVIQHIVHGFTTKI